MIINQPETQKWLTNITVVSLLKENQQFEVACYCNKIKAFRNGVEKDLSQVLQSDTIFSSVVSGTIHNNETLLSAFNTVNNQVIATEIIKSGRIQLSAQEREAEINRSFKEISALISRRTYNPVTLKPFPPSLIEKTIREDFHYSIANFPSSEQAAFLIKKLQEIVDIRVKNINILAEFFDPERIQIFVERAGQILEQVELVENFVFAEIPFDQFSEIKKLIGDDGEVIIQKSFQLKIR